MKTYKIRVDDLTFDVKASDVIIVGDFVEFLDDSGKCVAIFRNPIFVLIKK